MKVLTFVGTRPEIIKLSRVVARLDESVDHVLVHTGQNYDHELNGIFFEELGIRAPDHYLEVAGASLAETIANIIVRADVALERERPDAVLVLGDTNSALAVMSAKRRRIPVFHMEAGNRCFDQRVPEEINRKVVDHLSDVNMPYTEHARRHLLAEGFPPDRVIKTGSPQKEVLEHHREAIVASRIHSQLELTPDAYFVVSLHREENVDDPAHLASLLDALNAVAARYKLPMILSTHPRTRQRLQQAERVLDPCIRALPPLGLIDYVALEKAAFCTLSDSGTITEEAAILGFPAVTLREAHERPEGMDEGVLIMTGMAKEAVLDAIDVTRRAFTTAGPPKIPTDYDVDRVSWTVLKIILGYTDYVNRRVWFKSC